MSERVTDERLVDCVAVIDRCVLKLANTTMNISLEEWGEISNALLGVGIAHSATKGQLRDALAEVERLARALDMAAANINRLSEQSDKFFARATAAESDLAATKAKLEALPKVCDGLEQDAFEQWAISEGYDMSQHPLHWLFLHPKTSGARQGWKAAIEYCLAALTTKETTDAK